MSWVKKRTPGTSTADPQHPHVQMYNPNQHPAEANQWGQSPDNWYQNQGQQQQQYWNQQQQQPQFNQQPQEQAARFDNNQQYQNNVYQTEGSGEWSSKWGWDDEDNSNNVQNIGDSFTQDNTWNWTVEELKGEAPPKNPQIDRLTGKRGKLETPQWSVESQISQESSDDLLQTSESDKSRMMSRSSTISHSPISGVDLQPPLPTEENKEIVQHVEPEFARFPNYSGMNLESPPDNSEVPPPHSEAPINDRNQYLETGQLSQDNDLTLPPPPGLRRMVLGQMEPNDRRSNAEPPEGLHRMIPGESSSPETVLKRPNDPDVDIGDRSAIIGERSSVIGDRSATIGADTPPTPQNPNNRSETIGADTPPELAKKKQDLGNLVNSVRNLTVGDDDGETNERKHHSRQESSESERKSPSDRRERHHRYSPAPLDKSRRKYPNRKYDEDEDYYSDKERNRRRRERDEEYDGKYYSLRKDNKERKRRDYEKPPRKEEDYYYYARHEEEYEEPRSRASSRSDSYRERRDRRHRSEKEHRHHSRRHRDHMPPFAPYQGYGYEMYNQYYQQYHYYENLRKTNPQAYAQWYRKYYQNGGEAAPPYGGGGGEERASVHSGRSSANEEHRYSRHGYYNNETIDGYYRGSSSLAAGRYELMDDPSFARPYADQTDNSIDDRSSTVQRLTPAKFSTAHIKASIGSGRLVKVLPNYPPDGESGVVEIDDFETLLSNDDDYRELRAFPGPLIKGVTHKKTIIEYCETKIREGAHDPNIADYESYVLVWELLILLIRQNGMVVGADIAELLLKNQRSAPSVVGSSEDLDGGDVKLTTIAPKEDEVTNKFREFLLYGSVKEALEWAMKHGLWGHALFLASKLDKRTYANVMMRFANGLTINDPLQTLYQLLSGRLPAASTCVADEKWGDWKPHLAMIISNSIQRPELNCKAITALGDTLLNRGCLYAAQFCYLMAEVGFGQYGQSDAKLVLLGANHSEAFGQFARNEAIHMTEIYEYARSLNDDHYSVASLQKYKFLLATRQADVGLLEKSLQYLERIAVYFINNREHSDAELIDQVATLSDRLKYYDPVGEEVEDDLNLDTSRPDNSWLKDLRQLQNEYNSGVVQQQQVQEPQQVQHNQYSDVWGVNQQQPQQQQQQPEVNQYETYQPQQQWLNNQQQPPVETNQLEQQQQQQDFGQYQQWQHWNQEQQSYNQSQDDVAQPQGQNNYYSSNLTQPEDIATQLPQISLPNQQKERRTEENAENTEEKHNKHPQQQVPAGANNSGWFGGIFSKLTLKPKNQMKLPDDKNPSIVWDPEKKRWINTEDGGADGAGDFKPPPPKMAEMVAKIPEMVPKMAEPLPKMNEEPPQIPTGPNMFKMQRGRNLKKSYVDVFNPNKTASAGAPVPDLNIQYPQQQPQMNFFIPQVDPNAPTDFLTPAPPPNLEENTQQNYNQQ